MVKFVKPVKARIQNVFVGRQMGKFLRILLLSCAIRENSSSATKRLILTILTKCARGYAC